MLDIVMSLEDAFLYGKVFEETRSILQLLDGNRPWSLYWESSEAIILSQEYRGHALRIL